MLRKRWSMVRSPSNRAGPCFSFDYWKQVMSVLRKIRASLKWKLLSLTTMIILIVVTLIGYFSYYDTSRTIRRDIELFSAQILRQANLNLNRQYLAYEQGFLVLGTSQEFNAWLRVPPSDKYELIRSYQSLELSYMRSFIARHPEILSISLLSDLGGEFTYALNTGVLRSYSFAEEPWLAEVGVSQKIRVRVDNSHAYVDERGQPEEMLVVTLAGRFGRPEAKGYLKMDISLEPAQTILNEMKLGSEGQGMIAKPDGTILVHQDSGSVGTRLPPDIVAQLDAESGSYYRDETKQLVIFDTIPYTGWKTVALVAHEDIASSIERVRVVTIAVAALGLLLAILLVTLVTTSVTSRLSRLRRYMQQARRGDLLGRIDDAGEDEVADLSRAYNRMLDELDESIHKLTETKLVQQKAVLSAMQSQIHSHFLYNALESINSMAHLAGHADIERTAISLSRMLRYTSNYRDTEVRLADEVAHVEHYMNIIRIRFGEAVSFRADLPDDCRDVSCLKAALQPIAENAIKHGIESSGEPTILELTVRQEGGIIRAVFEDNGTGYDGERLQAFIARLDDVGGEETESYASLMNVGLLNVHYRLRTYYQRRDIGVRLEAGSLLGGVKVTVSFPAKRMADEMKDQR